MASLLISRVLRGGSAPGACRQLLMMRTGAVAALGAPRQIQATPALCKRLYGPEEEHEKVDDIHHWLHERYVALALLPLIPTALAFPHPALDTILCTCMTLHVHWRLSGVAEDYVHGQILPRIAQPLVLALSIFTFGSLCYFNYADVGFATAVRMLYTQL